MDKRSKTVVHVVLTKIVSHVQNITQEVMPVLGVKDLLHQHVFYLEMANSPTVQLCMKTLHSVIQSKLLNL